MLEFTDHPLRGHIIKSPDAMEHSTLKDTFVGHRMYAIYNLVLCVGQSTNSDYLRKRALNQNNIRLKLFLRNGATKMFNQNMPAKFSCV